MDSKRKSIIGIVTSSANDKTITVTVETYKKSPLYGKRIKSSKKYRAHDEENKAKVRSRAKGPEPEGLTVATIGGQTFAFIALERIGGVMVYNVTDPNNVTFTDYKNEYCDLLDTRI